MAKSGDKLKCKLRFSDFTPQPRRICPPIQGYEDAPLVSLDEAVYPLTSFVPEVEQMTQLARQYQFQGKYGLTDDETASILLYTMEWKPRDRSFCVILNDTLQATDRSSLRPWFLYLRLIVTSFTKLPSNSQHFIVYRGIKKNLSADYPVGSTVTWWGFSSCTMSLKVLSDKQLLGRSGTRTQFNIQCYSGKSIRSLSLFPGEEEVLLPPGRQFQVISCVDHGGGLHIIKLKEIQPTSLLINLVPQKSVILSTVEHLVKIPPPPACKNPELQKHITALYSDPVIFSLKTASPLEQQ